MRSFFESPVLALSTKIICHLLVTIVSSLCTVQCPASFNRKKASLNSIHTARPDSLELLSPFELIALPLVDTTYT